MLGRSPPRRPRIIQDLIIFSLISLEDHASILSTLLVQIYDISLDILGIPLD
jgi:hypothetical protein